MATSASRELQRRAMYEESHLDRLRQRYPDLDERGLQLKDLLDSPGVSSREGLPKLRAWLDAGEDPNAVLVLHGPTTKRSILSGALEHGRVDSVRLLLARGARVKARHFSDAIHGCSPERRALPIVKLLVSAGADVNKPDGRETCVGSHLMSAIQMNKYNVAKYLLSQGADVNYVVPGESFSPDALAVAHHNVQYPRGYASHPSDADIEFHHFLRNVVDAGGWKPYVRAPRVSLVVLRRLCEKDRARPPPELARLFALDKFIFWRVLAFWRTDRDLPHHITTSEREPPMNEYFD